MKKSGKILAAMVPLFLALGIQLLVVVLSMVGYGIVKGFQLASEGITDTGELVDSITGNLTGQAMLAVSAFASLSCLILFGLWYKKLIRGESRIRYTGIFNVKTIGILLLLAVGLQIGISIILTLISSLNPEWFEQYGEILEELGMGNTLLSALYIGIIAPVSEELIFRGVILNKARKALPFVGANILQALCFGIYHLNLVQGAYAFILGIYLGYVCYKFKTVIGSILLHMLINISGMLLNYVLTDKLVSNVFVVIILLIASALGVIYSTISIRKKGLAEDSFY